MFLLLLGSVIIAGYLYIKVKTRPPAPLSPGFDLDKQSVVMPGPERIHRNPLMTKNLLTHIFDDARTLHEAYQRSAVKYGDRPYLGTRLSQDSGYTFISYRDAAARAANLASGLVCHGTAPGQETFVGVYSQNRAEWVLTQHACARMSMPLVPLYDTLGPQAVRYIVNQANITTVVCDPPKLTLLLKAVDDCPQLKLVVKMGKVTDAERRDFEAKGIKILSVAEVERDGAKNKVDAVPPAVEDIAIVCYTSGTTGDPKGAMLSHGNLIADTAGIVYHLQQSSMKNAISEHDVHISYLPLAHMFEQVVQMLLVLYGSSMGFFRGDIKQLMDDVTTLRPTIFPSVPRLLNKLHSKISAKFEGGLKAKLLSMALASKKAELQRGIFRNNSFWDLLLFRKVQAALGGRVRLILTGSAPISADCLNFLRCAFGCPVVEGYGQTECTAAGTVTAMGDSGVGMVGPPLACNEIKLADVPEMNYYAENDEGEVCFRGPNVTLGYLHNEAKTRETIDEDGWLHSGDIGKWLPNGTLQIFDRKKSIFKLSQGEYVAPAKVENIYVRAPPVAQAFVYGDSLKPHLVGVLVLDPEAAADWIKEHVGESGSLEQLAKNDKVVKAVLEAVRAEGKAAGLHGFEQVRAVTLETELFSVDNGILTPTFKLKRPAAKKKFQSEIEELYARSS